MLKQLTLLILAYLTLSLATQHLLPTEELLLNSLTQTVSLNKAEAMLSLMVKYRWVGYVLAPVLLVF